MSEQAIVTAKANVMVYDDQAKKWNPSGSSPGISKVQIFQHLLNQSYRVVGRKLQDNEVVVNCLLAKGLKYNQANQTFLHWRGGKQVYGLHFQSKEEADMFAQTLQIAVDNLNRLAAAEAAVSVNGASPILSRVYAIALLDQSPDQLKKQDKWTQQLARTVLSLQKEVAELKKENASLKDIVESLRVDLSQQPAAI